MAEEDSNAAALCKQPHGLFHIAVQQLLLSR
jgi:hypothetical protein